MRNHNIRGRFWGRSFACLFLLCAAATFVSAGEPKAPEEMVLIPAGEFLAGEVDAPRRMKVNAFYMDKYEVTQSKYEKTMNVNPSKHKGPDHPVDTVSWHEAKEFCEKLGKRLPTEWEWERAAKAGSSTKYYWGEVGNSHFASFDGAWPDGHFPVGQRKPNAFGLYDMSGNVWEWTSTSEGKNKVLRGGSWFSSAHWVRSAVRITNPPTRRNPDMGFRCAKSVPATA
ncbi:MAG: formylglycine-generating enzyme family protein [Nitrospinales bacterium]